MASAADLAACAAAVERVRQAADLSEEKAQSSSGTLAWLLGAESAREAMQSDAAATRLGAETMAKKLDRWRLDPEPVTHADVLDFLRACGAFADVRALVEAAQLLDAGHAAYTIGSDTARDVVRDVAAGATVGLLGWATLALAGVVGAWVLSRFRRA